MDSSGVVTETPQRTESTTYDSQGRISQVSNDEGILLYNYDALGRKTATNIFPANADTANDTPERITSYSYDALGRLAGLLIRKHGRVPERGR